MLKRVVYKYIVKLKRFFASLFKVRTLCLFILLSGLLGLWTDNAAHTWSDKEMPVKEFTSLLHKKQNEALECLNNIYKEEKDKGNELSISKDDILYIERAKKYGIEYRVYNDTVLKFWTGNEINTGGLSSFPNETEFYYRATNYHCVCERLDINNSTFLALIKIKTAYKQDEMKQDVFVEGFNLPNHVEFVDKNNLAQPIPIYGIDNTELFKLSKVPYQRPNQGFKVVCGICWTMFCFLILLLFYKLYVMHARREISTMKHSLIMGGILLLILVAAFVKQPLYIFNSIFFTSKYYQTEFASSIGIVAIYTIVLSLFYYIVMRRKVPRKELEDLSKTSINIYLAVILQFICALLPVLLYYICIHFINNSKVNLSVVFIQDIDLVSFIALGIIISWYALLSAVVQQLIGMSLRPFEGKKQLYVGAVSIVVVILASFILPNLERNYCITIAILIAYLSLRYAKFTTPSIANAIIQTSIILHISIGVTIDLCEKRNHTKMTYLSNEIAQGKYIQKDDTAEDYISKTAEKVRHDAYILTLMKDSVNRSSEAEEYVRKKYLRGFWEKYSVDVQIVPISGDLVIRTDNEGSNKTLMSQAALMKNAVKVQKYENFYLNQNIRLPLSYLCKLPGDLLRKNEIVFLLYPSSAYTRMDVSANNAKYSDYATNYADISVAKYVEGKLQLCSGDYLYPPSMDALNYSKNDAYHYYKEGYNHYVTKFADDGKVVVSILAKSSTLHLMLFSSVFGCLFLIMVIYYSFNFLFRKKLRSSIFSRTQYSMMLIMFMAFVFMAGFCLQFFLQQYKVQQKMKLMQRTIAVQSYIMQEVGYRNSIKYETREWYQKKLQDFSSVMRADLILYDKYGCQYASSNIDLASLGTKNTDGSTTHLMLPQAKFPNLVEPDQVYEELLVNHRYHTMYKEVYNGYNVRVGYVQLLDPVVGTADRTPAFNFIIILLDIFLIITLVALAIIYFTNHRIARPLEEITSKLREFKLNEENPKIEYKNKDDEVGLLVSRYNAMVDKLKTAAETLAKNERDAAWREMARSIAHEIKNPLTPMKLTLQLAQKKQESDPEHFKEYFEKTCDVLVEQIENLSRIASEFSDFAKISVTKQTEIDVLKRLRHAVTLYENNPEGVILQSDITENDEAFIKGDDRQLSQVFNNIIRNAIQAIPEDKIGIVTIKAEKQDEHILISISDNGIGIPKENLKRIFEPNFTTKNSGMGLGLAITHGIIKNSGGDIWIESEEGEGTTFFIKWEMVSQKN